MLNAKFCLDWINKEQFIHDYKVNAFGVNVIHGWLFYYYHPDLGKLTAALSRYKPEYATSKKATYITTQN